MPFFDYFCGMKNDYIWHRYVEEGLLKGNLEERQSESLKLLSQFVLANVPGGHSRGTERW